VLCAANSPLDHVVSLSDPSTISKSLGPNIRAPDGVRHYLRGLSTNDPRALWDPYRGTRRQAEWDDHGEAYSAASEGPDLLIGVNLDEGIFRVSFYFVNPDGHVGVKRNRDYLIELKDASLGAGAYAAPALAIARVRDFYGGVYHQFIVRGDSKMCLIVRRNYSLNAICSGVFIDKLAGPEHPRDRRARAMMGGVKYAAPEAAFFDETPLLNAAVRAWASTDNAIMMPGFGAASQRLTRVQAIRAASQESSGEPFAARWRWFTGLWTDGDRNQWNTTMQQAWASMLRLNPQAAKALGMEVPAN
jgi:hypothetical protein